MRALICSELTGPEALSLGELPEPEPGPGELRIQVSAAALNFPDGLIVEGRYQFKPDLPFVPGSEAAGVIDALGSGVTEFTIGQRVGCSARWGAFAEHMIAPSSSCFAIPDGMPYTDAAAFGLAYGTSYHALVQRGRLRKGETVLILGAGGGVGLAAVQIAKALGARVIAGASSPEKLEFARMAGADAILNYREQDLRLSVKELTGGRGVDIVYDPIGGALAEAALRSIAWDGRYLVVGFASGAIPSLPVNLALIKNAAIIGVFWGAWSERNPHANRDNFESLLNLYGNSLLNPAISQMLTLAEVPEAIRDMLDGKIMGKIVAIM